MTDLQIVCGALGITTTRTCRSCNGVGEYRYHRSGGVNVMEPCRDCNWTGNITSAPDTLTPELAWEIETRARVLFSTKRWQLSHFFKDGIWTYNVWGWDNRFICGDKHTDRATALISALAKAMGGK